MLYASSFRASLQLVESSDDGAYDAYESYAISDDQVCQLAFLYRAVIAMIFAVSRLRSRRAALP